MIAFQASKRPQVHAMRMSAVHKNCFAYIPIKLTLASLESQNGHKKMAKLLMRRNADLNTQNSQGYTALHFCYRFGHIKLAEYLVSKGGDPTLRDHNGRQCHEMNGGSPMSPATSKNFAGGLDVMMQVPPFEAQREKRSQWMCIVFVPCLLLRFCSSFDHFARSLSLSFCLFRACASAYRSRGCLPSAPE